MLRGPEQKRDFAIVGDANGENKRASFVWLDEEKAAARSMRWQRVGRFVCVFPGFTRSNEKKGKDASPNSSSMLWT